MHANVVIVGSLNMDLIVRTPRLPFGGETLAGHGFSTAPGGKGANQAVAAARLGARAAMIGCVGDDAYGAALRDGLVAEGIDCSAVATVAGVSTGIASILVDDDGQNAIVIAAGANGEMSPDLLKAHDDVLASASVVIAQLEVPNPTVEAVLTRAHEHGRTVILNPAPATGPLPSAWYRLIDFIIPNESEAALLTGVTVNSPETALVAAKRLLEAGVKRVLITLGHQGVLYADGDGHTHYPVEPVNAIDTTAAGDTFVGGFAAALANGETLQTAISLGQQAAALAVTRPGAQPSIPYCHELTV